MKKIWFNGLNPKGTLRPRRIWNPGDVLEVADDVAEELLKEPGFILLKPEKPKKAVK